MKTIFLASGRSSRMDPIGDKNLLSFCGKPLIIHLLERAQQAGLENFIVVTNQENQELIKKALSEADFQAEITLQQNLEEGMAGGVSDGLKLVEDDESVMILGGNDCVEVRAYEEVLAAAQNHDGAVLAHKVEQYFPGGYLNVDEHQRITGITEKPGEGNEPSDLVNVVVHCIQQAGALKKELDEINKCDDGYEQALQKLFEAKNIQAVAYDGAWQAIKYPWHVLDMMNLLLAEQEAKISPEAEIAKTAVLKGENIVIEDGAKIFDHAVIQSPCYIGKNAIVGNNALVRESCLGAGSGAGYNTEIARSYVAENVTTHMAYVGDSIVDRDVNFGAFSSTANLRLDHKPVKVSIKDQRISSQREKLGAIVGAGAQIGTHAMLMPGCKIAAGGLIQPGAIHK